MSVNGDQRLGVTDHMASSAETGTGYLTGPGLVDHPVVYAVVDGRAIHDGCIDMGPVEQVEAEAVDAEQRRRLNLTTAFAGAEPGGDGTGAEGDGGAGELPEVAFGVGLPVDSNFLWTNGRVAWSVDAGVPNQGRITDAIAHIEQNTGIRFVRRTAANAASLPNWINIISNGNATFSSSAIGMRGGSQTLRLADAHPWPILVHEFLHALGVYHEQSRSDRDSFVEIKWDNIQDGPPPADEADARGNFQTKPGATDYFDYDYGSIMHYPGTSFAKDRTKPTIVPKRSGVTIGQRTGMSPGDRQTVAKMYERFFTKGWSGVWRAGSGRYGLWANAEWENFRTKWQEWSADGLRLTDLHVRTSPSGLRYSGVFLPGTGGHGLWVNATWESFHAKWQEWSAQGLRLQNLHVHQVEGQNRFSGVFLPGTGGHGLWVNATWDDFRAKWQEWSGQGLRLHDLHVHEVNGQNRFSGVFLPGTGRHGLWVNANWDSFVAKWQEWSRDGLRLVGLNVHRVGGDTRYSGAFLPGTDAFYLWANVTWESFRAKWDELGGQGLRLIDFEFVNPVAGAQLDEADAAGDEFGTDEAFGGLVEAGSAVEAAAMADGDGAVELDEPVALDATGGVELPGDGGDNDAPNGRRAVAAGRRRR